MYSIRNTTSMIILIHNTLFVYVVFADFSSCFALFLIQNNFLAFHTVFLDCFLQLKYNLYKLVIQ